MSNISVIGTKDGPAVDENELALWLDTANEQFVGNTGSSWWVTLLTWLKSIFVTAIVVTPNSNISAKFAEAAASGTDIVFTPGTYIVPPGGWVYEATRHSILTAGNVVWDATGLQSGYALTLRGNDGRDHIVHDFQQATHRIQGMHIKGPFNNDTLADAISIQDVGGGSRGNSHVNLENVKVTGFRTQTFLGDNTWCVRFVNVFFNGAKQYGVYCDSGINAGENYTFIGGTIAGAKNTGGTGVGVFITDTGNVDAYFHGTSFDYNDCDIFQKSGNVLASGCHFEGNNPNGPMVKVQYTPGLERTLFTVVGGVFAPTEQNANRVSLIDVMGGNAAFVNLVSPKYGVWEKQLDVVRHLNGAAYNVQMWGGDLQTGGNGLQSLPGDWGNGLANGNYASGTNGGWANGGTVSWNYGQTAIKDGTDTYSLQITGTGVAGSTNSRQAIPVRAGQTVFARTKIYMPSYTAGKIEAQVRFFDHAGTYSLGFNVFGTVTAVNNGYVEYRASYRVPVGNV